MTRKDHLIDSDDLVRSIIIGGTAKAECGFEKHWTREDLESLEYRHTCKECISAAAGKVAPEPMSILPKLGWTALVERAWRNRYEASLVPTWTITSWQSAGTYTASWAPTKEGSSE